MSDAEGDDEEYQSGPFCRHWGQLGDCDETCGTCGHRCGDHERGEDGADTSCRSCECPAWSDAPDSPREEP